MESIHEILDTLYSLDGHEDIRNIVIIDYGSLKNKQDDLNSILQCWFLKKYFHVIIIVPKSPINNIKIDPKTFNQQMYTTLYISPFVLARQNTIDYIVTQIIIFVVDKLKPLVRRAYYCLSTDKGCLKTEELMDYGEHVYCSMIKSLEDFLQLQYHLFDDTNDPCIMNVFPILKNNVPRETVISKKSGKAMFFVEGKWFYDKSVKNLWYQLRQFGDEQGLHVSVTTAFPTNVDKKVQ